MSEHPTIGWVGGLSRSGQHLEEAAEKAGCQVEFHDGDVKGNRSKTLREIVRRSQALVIAVGLISHQGALTARAEAKQAGIPVVFVKKASQAQASEAFESLKQQLGTKGALARGRGGYNARPFPCCSITACVPICAAVRPKAARAGCSSASRPASSASCCWARSASLGCQKI
jgi:hypothetical protein